MEEDLVTTLKAWIENGGDLSEKFLTLTDETIDRPEEARAVCQALAALRSDPALEGDESIGSALHLLAAFFQSAQSEETASIFAHEGLPHLRWWVRDALTGTDVSIGDALFLLKILAIYHQPEDLPLLVAAARRPIADDNFMWSIIFDCFQADHPLARELAEALRDPLPERFLGVAYLDMTNRLALAGALDVHPFDTPAGTARLEQFLRDTDQAKFSYAHSAAAALPHLNEGRSAALLALASSHADPSVRLESAWARAKLGDAEGISMLVESCRNPSFSQSAQAYLEELGHEDTIPAECLAPEFQALAVMANWLSHPMEFGRPPSRVSLFDHRLLFWPTDDELLAVYLVKYEYDADDENEADSGIGMVGSTTFALFGETTVDMSAEDLYALHCNWECETPSDEMHSTAEKIAAGRKLLRQRNPGF